MSQSLTMDENQIQRALQTFSASKNLISSNNWEQSSIKPSQASRITDSTQHSSVEQSTQGLKPNPNPSKKGHAKAIAKTTLDAEFVKPFTRSQARILASQDSQSIENNPPTTCAEYDVIPTHAPEPSGSRLIIKRLKN